MVQMAMETEIDYSRMADADLLERVFSREAWYREADLEMHRRLVAGRTDILAGRKNEAWGLLLEKIVGKVMAMNRKYGEIALSGNDKCDLLSEFFLQLRNRDSWVNYNGAGRLIGYLVNRNSPLFEAWKLIKNPRRKSSDELVKITTIGEIGCLESLAYGGGKRNNPESTAYEDDGSDCPEPMAYEGGREPVEVDAEETCDPPKDPDERRRKLKRLKKHNVLLVQHQANIQDTIRQQEKPDLGLAARDIFREVAMKDPTGARAYCLFTFGRDEINVSKFDEQDYIEVLMGGCKLEDRVIARIMGKSENAVAQARCRFLAKLEKGGRSFMRQETLQGLSGGTRRGQA